MTLHQHEIIVGRK